MTSSAPSSPGKWLDFVHLCDALDEEGCPICTLVERASQKHLDGLLYENVNDVGIREKLSQSAGFCNWHAWMATRIPSANAGVAIIYEDLLRHVMEKTNSVMTVRRLKSPRFSRSPKTAGRILKKDATCPICDTARFVENIFLHELLRQFQDEEIQAKFNRSFGLCLPHLESALNQFPEDPHLPALISAQRDKMNALLGELRDYIRKCDYRFASEPKGAEQTAWLRAIQLFVGKREIFNGNL